MGVHGDAEEKSVKRYDTASSGIKRGRIRLHKVVVLF